MMRGKFAYISKRAAEWRIAQSARGLLRARRDRLATRWSRASGPSMPSTTRGSSWWMSRRTSGEFMFEGRSRHAPKGSFSNTIEALLSPERETRDPPMGTQSSSASRPSFRHRWSRAGGGIGALREGGARGAARGPSERADGAGRERASCVRGDDVRDRHRRVFDPSSRRGNPSEADIRVTSTRAPAVRPIGAESLGWETRRRRRRAGAWRNHPSRSSRSRRWRCSRWPAARTH